MVAALIKILWQLSKSQQWIWRIPLFLSNELPTFSNQFSTPLTENCSNHLLTFTNPVLRSIKILEECFVVGQQQFTNIENDDAVQNAVCDTILCLKLFLNQCQMQYEAMFDPNSVVVCDVMCDLACNAGIYVAFIS